MTTKNKNEITIHRDMTVDTPFDSSLFQTRTISEPKDKNYVFSCNLGTFTVLDRMTGSGYRDIETGWRDSDNTFWLATNGIDVRQSGAKTIGEAIQWVKDNANACIAKKIISKPNQTC
jgi:hypothetical protein